VAGLLPKLHYNLLLQLTTQLPLVLVVEVEFMLEQMRLVVATQLLHQLHHLAVVQVGLILIMVQMVDLVVAHLVVMELERGVLVLKIKDIMVVGA
jgi:hypothetical protein